MKRILNIIAIVALMPLTGFAQGDDLGLWTSIGIEGKINKKLSVDAETELRMGDNISEAERWSIGVNVSYKISRWLKASVGGSLMDNRRTKTTYYADGSPEYTSDYWSQRMRAHVSLTADKHFGRLQVSLRERWQYTYRPATYVYRFDVDADEYEDKPHEYKGKGKNVLRSRLEFDYDLPRWKADPYASVEFFNAWSVEKMRYTAGINWKLTKQHHIGINYKYQYVRSNKDFDNEPNKHIIGLEYTYKF